MNKRLLLAFILILLIVPLVLAQNSQTESPLVYRQDVLTDFKIQCVFNGSLCSADTQCNVSVNYPSSALFIDNQQMTNQTSFWNYTFIANGLNETGDYTANVFCSDPDINRQGNNPITFLVTPTGKILSTGQGIVYLLVLVLGMTLFLLSLWGAIVIPWKHGVDGENILTNLNNLKYVKLTLWFVSYILILWNSFLLWNVSFGFLHFSVGANFMELVFKILMALMYPIIILFFIAMIVNFFWDGKLRKDLERGLVVRM